MNENQRLFEDFVKREFDSLVPANGLTCDHGRYHEWAIDIMWVCWQACCEANVK